MKILKKLLALPLLLSVLACVCFAASGTLVYENTFEGASDVNKTVPVVDMGLGSANSSVAYHWGTAATFSVSTPAGASSQMLAISPSNGASSSALAFINANITKPGTYTLEFDYFCPASTVTDGRVIRFGFMEDATEKYFVKGTLTHISHTHVLTEGTSLSGFYFMMRYGSNYASSDVFYVDNIRLYYKAPREPLAVDPTLGEAIVSEDFETVSSGKVLFNSADNGGTLAAYANSFVVTQNISKNEAFAGKLLCFNRGGSLNTSYVTATPDGNMAVRVDQPKNGSSTMPHFGLCGGNSNSLDDLALSAPGTYTVKADFIIPAECVSKITQVYYQINIGGNWLSPALPLDTTKTGEQTYTLIRSVTVEEGSSLNMIRFIGLASGANANVYFYVDNIQLYYAPKTEALPSGTPGINALTGTALPWTFESTYASIPVTVSDAAIVNNPHSDSVNGSASVMRFTLDAWKAWVYAFKEPIENDRPVYVSFDYYKTADDPNAALINLYICKNGTNDIAANLSSFTAGGSWRHYGGFPAFDGAYSASDSSKKNTDPLMSVNLQHGGAAGNGHTYAYYDNISVIPAYKITYMANDGTDTELKHEYVLFDGNASLDNIASSVTPDLSVKPSSERFGYSFLGFSLDKNAVSADAPAKIELDHRDITLYGVWQKDVNMPDAVSLVYDFETAGTCVYDGASCYDGMAYVSDAVEITEIDTDARAMRYAVIRLRGNASELTMSFTTKEDLTYTAGKAFSASVTPGDAFDTVVIATGKIENADWTGIIDSVKISVNGDAEIEDIAFCTEYTETPYNGEKAALYASSDEITSDGGSVTLSPFYRAPDGTVLRAASYETDSLCAVLEKQEDGSAVLKGRMNGTVTVKAHFSGTELAASVGITVSGQSERVPSASFKVICFGNSIRSHSPNASLGWSGSWGMAASSEDKDYAHRFIYYLNEKFGNNAAVLYEGYWMAGIEGIWKQYENDETHDFTSDMAQHMAVAKEVQPDIITVQCGENASVTNAAAYENALTQFVLGLQAVSPNAKIVLCTPFWGGNAMIEGVYAAAKATGASVARLDTLNTAENRATGLFDNGAVANHPGDTGMDNIAKLLFEQINTTLTEENAVAFTVRPTSVSVTADKTVIDTDGGTLSLTAAVLPADAAQSVTWRVDDETAATIDENGILKALRDGLVTVTASSKQDETVTGSLMIEITNQTAPFTLSFISDLPSAVLPSAAEAKGLTDLSAFTASCDAYRFLGWSREEGGMIVRTVSVEEDTTLCARFEKAFRFDFARDGYDENFTVVNGFNRYIADGVYLMLATDTSPDAKLAVHSPVLSLDPNEFDTLRIRMSSSAFADTTKLTLTLHTSTGDLTKTLPVTSTDMTDYVFPLDDVTDTITGFTLEPTDTDCSVRLDLAAFERGEEGALYATETSVYAAFPAQNVSGTAVIALYDTDGRLVRTLLREAVQGEPVTVYAEEGGITLAKCFVFADGKTLSPQCGMTALTK